MSACAAALAKKTIVQIGDGWEEPLNIFSLVSLPLEERKTAVSAEVTTPIEEWEAEENVRLSPQIAEAASSKKILEERLKRIQQRAAKAETYEAKELEQEANTVAKELNSFKMPASLRLLADDVTPERATSLLAEQGGKLAIISAEGGIFDILAGRYSHNLSANFEVFLKGHAGDNLRVDRINRPPEHVKKPALTVGLAVQPDILHGLYDKPGFRGRGLLARFLYSLPASMVGNRNTNPPPLNSFV